MTKNNHSRGRTSVSVSVRLSAMEKHELQKSAKDQTLSEHIRSKLFYMKQEVSDSTRLSAFERQKLLAQILAELAKSNLSKSFHEISQAAKIGALPLTPDVVAEINAAIFNVNIMRNALLKALGVKQRGDKHDP